jgi:VanZ family protein
MSCTVALIINFGVLSWPPIAWLQGSFPRIDLVLHMLAFACLAILAFVLFGLRVQVVVVMLAAGAAIELAQAFEPAREASFADMIANAAGIALAAGMMMAVRKTLAEQRVRRAWNGYDEAAKPQGA